MARILDSILPESVHNEGLLFVPQIIEDLMRGKPACNLSISISTSHTIS